MPDTTKGILDQTTELISNEPAARKPTRWAGVALPALAGLIFWLTPLGRGLQNLSYDLLFLFKPVVHPEGVVIVSMDERSFRDLGQKPSNWSRSLHARLLERMTQDHARLVVFDVWLTDPHSQSEDEDLSRAIKSNGRVVLAAKRLRVNTPGLEGASFAKPLPIFCEATTNLGLAEILDPGSIARRWYGTCELGPSLAWAAAVAAGVGSLPGKPGVLWLNYYGPQGTLQSISYCDATNQPPGYFGDKVVFVGDRPEVLYHSGRAGDDSTGSDQLRTPYSRWGGINLPGVEVMATAYLNLERNEALTPLAWPIELLVLLASGLVLGWGADRLRPIAAGIAGGVALLAVFLMALTFHAWLHTWFSWMLVAGVELPAAVLWKARGLIGRTQPVPELSPFLSSDGKRRIPNVPDHALIGRIGEGAYGEVWLAKNAIGMFRAVKFIFRDRYATADPYEREFRGVQKYMPISLDHPGLVHVLHVGQNQAGGYFFYIMEAGDDEVSESRIDPDNYAAKNLSSELRKNRKFSVGQCVTWGLQLTEALAFLQGKGLIHRDIKPSNIIFVKGVPKLADVGLVTEVAPQGSALTYVGTQGYIPPEGPGTAAGDVYSLGKVLYEVSMGKDRMQFPELPTAVMEGKADPGLLMLNQIILKACESEPSRRYPSAAELRLDLARLQEQMRQTKVVG